LCVQKCSRAVVDFSSRKREPEKRPAFFLWSPLGSSSTQQRQPCCRRPPGIDSSPCWTSTQTRFREEFPWRIVIFGALPRSSRQQLAVRYDLWGYETFEA
ncbi:unnamed protein product, partial [Ectocarpus sp. 8 AP-2014]